MKKDHGLDILAEIIVVWPWLQLNLGFGMLEIESVSRNVNYIVDKVITKNSQIRYLIFFLFQNFCYNVFPTIQRCQNTKLTQGFCDD